MGEIFIAAIVIATMLFVSHNVVIALRGVNNTLRWIAENSNKLTNMVEREMDQ